MIDFIVVFFIYGIHFIIARKAYVNSFGNGLYSDIVYNNSCIFYIFMYFSQSNPFTFFRNPSNNEDL